MCKWNQTLVIVLPVGLMIALVYLSACGTSHNPCASFSEQTIQVEQTAQGIQFSWSEETVHQVDVRKSATATNTVWQISTVEAGTTIPSPLIYGADLAVAKTIVKPQPLEMSQKYVVTINILKKGMSFNCFNRQSFSL